MKEKIMRHIISILIENESGALSRGWIVLGTGL
jgi:acetolactate synthase small subunit